MKTSPFLPAHLLQFFQSRPAVFKPRSRFLVACSAGPDSTALLLALKDVASYLKFDFTVGHINHGLRGRASDQDEAFVRSLSQTLGWKALVVRKKIRSKVGNLEEMARDARYTALTQMARKARCSFILTAHTRDDQVETILMNLVRGAGLQGLGGMSDIRALRSGKISLVRPLLDVDKSELESYLKQRRARFRTDKTNRSEKFFRNWIRRRVVPLFENRSPGFKKRVANLASIARDEEQYWESLISGLLKTLLRSNGSGWLLDFKGLLRYPPAIQRRFLRRAAGGDLLSFDAVERWRRWMNQPPSSGRIWQLRKGWTVERLSKSKGFPSASLFRLETSSKGK